MSLWNWPGAILGGIGTAASRIWSFLTERESDSFKSKLILLAFDKVVIGVVLGAAYWWYDSSNRREDIAIEKQRTEESRQFQERLMTLTDSLERERARESASRDKVRLLADLLPRILDDKGDVTSRADLLRAAADTASLADETVVELAPRLLKQGLSPSNFARLVSPSVPAAIARIADRGAGLYDDYWFDAEGNKSAGTWAIAVEEERSAWAASLLLSLERASPQLLAEKDRRDLFVQQGHGLHFLLSRLDERQRIKLAKTRVAPFDFIAGVQTLLNSVADEATNSQMVLEILKGPIRSCDDAQFVSGLFGVLEFQANRMGMEGQPFDRIHPEIAAVAAKFVVGRKEDVTGCRDLYLDTNVMSFLNMLGEARRPVEPVFLDYCRTLRKSALESPAATDVSNPGAVYFVFETLTDLGSDEVRAEFEELSRLPASSGNSLSNTLRNHATKSLQKMRGEK